MSIHRRDFARLGVAAIAAFGLGVPARAQDASPFADVLAHIDPQLRPSALRMLTMSAQSQPLGDATVAKRRTESASYAAPLLPDIRVDERQIAGARGHPPVTVFVINAGGAGARPGILHTHGGGFILGQARYELRFLQELARDLDCIVVSVEYRLAPEARFTGSLEDNYAGLRWMHASARELGLDPKRVALLGESAGGGHAALLAIAARDRGEVPVAFQALIYPMLDDRTGSSVRTPAHIGAVLWDAASNRYGWRSLLGVEPGGGAVPAAGVPARVADLAGLPPTFIAVGGVDLFVSEDITYGRRLNEAGVPVELHVFPGGYHAFDRVASETEIAERFTRIKMDALRRAFGQALPA
ncbi:alpha/beta hydrolase [Caulobacter sp. NIBR2454]|uniref:alpha/beta hydrolase n=1 Tax=Caulobacter sp. NIBR2454 TaxID=3015996 RepID=UPI0022B6E62C|nr:alpha/beta hydrolase [Caulobacter sp. NIBR2454]